MAKKVSRRKQTIPKDETKSARFVRVVTPRINKAVKSIGVIAYCSGSTYEYTSKQVEEITAALFAAVNQLVDRFAATPDKTESFVFKP